MKLFFKWYKMSVRPSVLQNYFIYSPLIFSGLALFGFHLPYVSASFFQFNCYFFCYCYCYCFFFSYFHAAVLNHRVVIMKFGLWGRKWMQEFNIHVLLLFVCLFMCISKPVAQICQNVFRKCKIIIKSLTEITQTTLKTRKENALKIFLLDPQR